MASFDCLTRHHNNALKPNLSQKQPTLLNQQTNNTSLTMSAMPMSLSERLANMPAVLPKRMDTMSAQVSSIQAKPIEIRSYATVAPEVDKLFMQLISDLVTNLSDGGSEETNPLTNVLSGLQPLLEEGAAIIGNVLPPESVLPSSDADEGGAMLVNAFMDNLPKLALPSLEVNANEEGAKIINAFIGDLPNLANTFVDNLPGLGSVVNNNLPKLESIVSDGFSLIQQAEKSISNEEKGAIFDSIHKSYKTWIGSGNAEAMEQFLVEKGGELLAGTQFIQEAYQLWQKEGNVGSEVDFLREVVNQPSVLPTSTDWFFSDVMLNNFSDKFVL